MKIVDRFLNKSEEIVFKELSAVATDNALRVFPKPRLSDVLVAQGTHLPARTFDYFTRSHFDFLVTDSNSRPFMAVEYDGPFHADAKQIERDGLKNHLCEDAGLPLLRINANHVTKRFRGMTLLRWIIEVSQLQIWFDDAQTKGQVPYDEPFDPAMIMSDGSGRKWPYWLSVDANTRINQFLRKQVGAKAWVSLRGHDRDKNIHSFEYLRFGDHFLFVRTAARDQGVAVPVFDMLSEISHCEMDEQLARHLEGSQRLMPLKEFKALHDRVCEKYNMHPGGWMGSGLDVSGSVFGSSSAAS